MAEVFMKIIGRKRSILLGHINQTDVVGTPEAFKWLYEFFIKKHVNKSVIKAKTYDNPFFEGYIETKETYTTAQVDAYLNGSLSISIVQRLYVV
jgi:hypothetical protein